MDALAWNLGPCEWGEDWCLGGKLSKCLMFLGWMVVGVQH